eukprot:15453787-Alexandrium_andersonii.AAC.1
MPPVAIPGAGQLAGGGEVSCRGCVTSPPPCFLAVRRAHRTSPFPHLPAQPCLRASHSHDALYMWGLSFHGGCFV